MSNCHHLFLDFNKAISLSEREKEKLLVSRDAIAQRISAYFKAKNFAPPEFRGQGSYMMGTSIRPTRGYYDLDLGVIIKELTGSIDDWPRTESIHQHVYNAVLGHTSIKPISKSTCVRVVYKSPYFNNDDLSYHIDLPIYGKTKSFWSGELKDVIGMKGSKQWSEYSDPQGFTKWFTGKCESNKSDIEQLKRIVKYLKAWKDSRPDSPKLPSGMILTVLAAKNFQEAERDDVALINTVREFESKLSWLFTIEKPVEPYNNLANLMSSREEDNFMKALSRLLRLGERAIESRSEKKSITIWTTLLGDRFNQKSEIFQERVQRLING